MRDSLRAVVAATDARMLHDNTAFAEAFARVLDESELQRVILAETVWKDGLQARERGDVEEATMLFEAAIDGRGKGLCDDIKAGRDRVVDMRRELLALHVGVGGAAGGVWDLLGGFLGRCACCSLLAPPLVEDNDQKEKVAKGKYELASDLHARGDYDDALALYEEALLLTEACGHDSLQVAATKGSIASVYDSQRKYDEALVEYQKSLEIKIQVLGHDHLSVAATYNNIAIVYESQGKYDEALVEYQKSLDIKIRVVGHVHPDVAFSMGGFGATLKKMGKEVEGKEMCKEAAAIWRSALGPEHPHTKWAESEAA